MRYTVRLAGILIITSASASCTQTTENANAGNSNTSNGNASDEVESGELYVDIYDPEYTCDGTTLLADLHDSDNPRLVEVDMQGQVVWQYDIPDDLKQYHNPGLDVELLPDDHILFVLPRNGVYEIDRSGNVVWSHLETMISHDADRLPNGNTLFVYGAGDALDEPQVQEVDPDGEPVWLWYARDQYNVEPYADIWDDGWTHANAVTRLENGNTLVSLRNFNLTTEVTAEGTVAWSFEWSTLGGDDPHEPEVLPNGNLLICLQHQTPHQAVQIDPDSGEVVWEYYRSGLRTVRDCDRLPNGNTLIVGVLRDEDDSVVFEVTPAGSVVWQLKIKDAPAENQPGWFYKAQRVCEEWTGTVRLSTTRSAGRLGRCTRSRKRRFETDWAPSCIDFPRCQASPGSVCRSPCLHPLS